MNNIKYIQATAEHIPLLVDSRVDFLAEYWGKPEAPVEAKLREELRRFFETEIPAQSYITWLAFDEAKMISIGGMKLIRKPGSFRLPDGMSGYIMNMYTLPDYRRQGIATEILHRLMDTGKALGIKMFELHATREGEPLYTKDGFEFHEEPSYRRFVW